MKRIVLLVLAMLLLACAIGAQQQARKHPGQTRLAARPFAAAASASCTVYTGIDFTWQYVANLPACPANGAPSACYVGFTLTDTTSGTVLATPAALGPTALAFQWTPGGGLFYGTHSFSLVADGYDSNGVAVQSAPATTSATNAVTCLNPPTAFTATEN